MLSYLPLTHLYGQRLFRDTEVAQIDCFVSFYEMNPFPPRRSASAGAAIRRARALDMFTPPESHTKKMVQFDVPPPDDWIEVSKE